MDMQPQGLRFGVRHYQVTFRHSGCLCPWPQNISLSPLPRARAGERASRASTLELPRCPPRPTCTPWSRLSANEPTRRLAQESIPGRGREQEQGWQKGSFFCTGDDQMVPIRVFFIRATLPEEIHDDDLNGEAGPKCLIPVKPPGSTPRPVKPARLAGSTDTRPDPLDEALQIGTGDEIDQKPPAPTPLGAATPLGYPSSTSGPGFLTVTVTYWRWS